MIKALRKTLLIACVVIIGTSTLISCGKDDPKPVEQTNLTAEETLDKFMEIRKEGDVDELYKLVWPKYIEIQNLTKDSYIQAVKDFDFKNSIEVIDYRVTDITDVEENIKKTKVTIKYTDSSKTEKNQDAIYALIKEGDVWMVSPDGVIDSIDYNTEFKISQEERIFIYLTKETKYTGGSIFNLKVTNHTKSNFSFGWTGGFKVIVDTDEGQFIADLKTPIKAARGLDDVLKVTVPNVNGNIKQITMTSLIELGQDGLPYKGDTAGKEVIVYKK